MRRGCAEISENPITGAGKLNLPKLKQLDILSPEQMRGVYQ
jgi:hypothetical protein